MFYGTQFIMSPPTKNKLKRQSQLLSSMLSRTLSYKYRDLDSTFCSLGASDDPSELSTQLSAPGVLKVFGDSVCTGTHYKSVLATGASSAQELVKEALERYALDPECAGQYVLCDVVGQAGDSGQRWQAQCFRVFGDNEKPLLIQELWKPREGLSRRFELRKKSDVEELAARDVDTTTAVVQVDGENSAGQTALFLSALLGHTSAVRLLLAFGANPNHRCLDGSTPTHAGASSGRGLVLWHLLQAGGDLRLRDQQGRTPRDWAEQGDAKQSWEVLELMQWCRTHMSALVHSGELAPSVSLSQLQASSGPSLCGSLPSLRLVQADRALRQGQIRSSPKTPALGFGQLSSLQPPALITGIPVVDPKELVPTQGEPDHTYDSSSHTIMTNLLWKGHPVTVRQLKNPESSSDVLLADLQHCSILHHPGLLLLMALSPSEDLSRLSLLFEPVWLGSLYILLHPASADEDCPPALPGLLPGPLLLQVLEALLFLQSRCWAHGGLSSHAVQLVRPGLAKVSHLEHGRPLHQPRLQPRLQQDCPQRDPNPGLPPPPELYPWLPLELIRGDMPAPTSDLYSFCVLAQEVFTGELPWAGGEGLEVKAKLEAGQSPDLDPLLPAPYQALVQAGLGLEPADRWGSLQSTRYLLRKAMAKDSAPKASSPLEWTTLSPVTLGSLPEHLYCEGAPRARARARASLVLPSPGPSQVLETPETTGHGRDQQNAAWDSGSSLTLGSSRSPSPSPSPSLHCCPEPISTVRIPLPHAKPASPVSRSLPAPSALTCGSLSNLPVGRKFCQSLSSAGATWGYYSEPPAQGVHPCVRANKEASMSRELRPGKAIETQRPRL